MPKLPVSLDDVHNVLFEYSLKTNRGENFLTVNDNENNIITFSCLTNIQFLSECEDIYLDGMFNYCTTFFTQLFTIHGLKNGHYVPLVFFLLPNTTRETYVKALNYVKEECSKVKDFFPKSVTADFELAIHCATRNVFPNAKSLPSWTSMVRKIQE
jgi:hypothetical protein